MVPTTRLSPLFSLTLTLTLTLALSLPISLSLVFALFQTFVFLPHSPFLHTICFIPMSFLMFFLLLFRPFPKVRNYHRLCSSSSSSICWPLVEGRVLGSLGCVRLEVGDRSLESGPLLYIVKSRKGKKRKKPREKAAPRRLKAYGECPNKG